MQGRRRVMMEYPWKTFHLDFCRLLGILGHSERYVLNMTVKDDALPGFVVDKSRVSGDNGIWVIVRQRRDTWVPVLLFPVKVYSQCTLSHGGRARVSINWFVSFRFHSKTTLLRLLDGVVHRGPKKGEFDVGIGQKKR